VSVARAAYSNADVIIFDDPLSALDPEVALKLFDECIIGFLNGKTRLLVTNQLQCLSKCDMIVALGKRGIVLEQGTYEDLIQGEGEVQRLLQDLDETSKKAQSREVEGIKALATTSVPKMLEAAAKKVSNPEKEEVKSLVTKEEREVGAVKFQVYSRYIKAGGGIFRFLFVFSIFVISTAMNLVRDVWISLWTSDTNFVRFSKGFYLGGYGGFAMLVGVITFFRSYFLAVFGIHASKTLHMNLITSVFRAPMSFFDTTPTGRILSRFSKDMFSMDQELTESIDFVLFMALSLIFSMATIAFATPWFALLFLPLAFIYIRILNYFRSVSRETKRLESLSRSPVFTHFSETLGGLSTIRAYGESTNFLNDFESKLDLSTQAAYCNKTGDRWLSTRLEMIGASIAGFAALLATQIVVSNGVSGVGQNSSYSSLAGLSLTYAIQITGMLQWVVRSFAQVEAAMNSVERILYYSEQIEKEAAMDSSDLEKSAKQDPSLNPATKAVTACGGKVEEVHPQWPSKGMIQMTNLRMRYRSSTPLVIKGLNVHIEGGQRIGVVGRTGSGKSSLLLCLMRLVEPEIDDDSIGYKAPIRIDGVDVMRIGLKVLRSAISIIPQNPVLFSGTIRSNLDPFEEYSDEQIWLALEKCGMKHTVMDIPNGLLAVVAEYGENLSQGQRQLLCLGRALLKQSRVLLLDEATSSVDFETDHEIQRTLREAFPGCTVLTIAHRVNTIMDSDKILVMKDGVAVEFAPPKELLADEDSLFREIVRHSETESRS
jgi:ATP-binding cassette, subfamily C (CFTR/MRP), member 1